MTGPHAVRWAVLAAACGFVAFFWQRHGVAAERADRVAAIEERLRTARLRAADDLARTFLEDFGPDARVGALAESARAALRAQELLERRDPASARALLQPLAAAPDAP